MRWFEAKDIQGGPRLAQLLKKSELEREHVISGKARYFTPAEALERFKRRFLIRYTTLKERIRTWR
jgi:hypothetical protein